MKNSSRKMTPFDFLRLVHDKKIKWEDLNEDEQKTYNKFIINRALGFNNNMLDIVNRLQGYDVTPKESFKYYQSMTGDKFRFNKWIKGSKDKSFNSELLLKIASYLECSKKQASEYLNILSLIDKIALTIFTIELITKILVYKLRFFNFIYT